MGTKVQHKSEGAAIKDLLQGVNFHRQIVKVLPKHLSPDRFVRVALTAIQRNPDLLKCDKESFFNSLLSLTELGLEPDGRRAHLIPFWSEKRKTYECQLIIDYKGYVDLITRPGKGNDVSTVYSEVVREHDDFLFNRGIVERHIIDLHKTEKERGPVIGAYVIIRMKDGAMKCEVMNVDEIAKIKARSKASKGPWQTDENEMRKKTVLRRSIKTMPINDQTAKALEVDYDRFEALDGSDSPKLNAPETPVLEAEFKTEDKKDDGQAKDEGYQEPGGEAEQEETDGNGQPVGGMSQVKKELFEKLRALCLGDQKKIAAQLKRLTAYKSKKTGRESEGKSNLDEVSEMEAKIALENLKREMETD